MGLKPFWIKKNDTVHKVGGVAIPAHYPASKITYDNTDSGLVATDAQDAIDELNDIKSDKVSGATNGNLAGLDANGNLTDSGIAAGNTSISSIGDGTLTGAVSAENEAIDAIVNVYGGKNLWDYTKFINGVGISQNNGVYTNTLTDTRNYLHLVVNALNSSLTVISTLINDHVSSTGNKEYKRTIPSGTAYFEIKHNGLTQDFVMYQPVSVTGDFILSLNITSVDPSTVGGLSFTDIMLRDARISDPTYAPYAMTNRELTEKVSIYIKNYGSFAITLDANTYTLVSTSNIENGTLPSDARKAIFKVYSASNSVGFNTRVYSEADYIYAWTDVAQRYAVKWYELNV